MLGRGTCVCGQVGWGGETPDVVEVSPPLVSHRPSSGGCVGSRALTTSCGRPRCPHGQGVGGGAEAPVVPAPTPFSQRGAYTPCVGAGKGRKA
eukprot:6214107-Pleurochrysis_carterae.AAC.7